MTGDARVTFRDATGRESQAELALVSAEELAAGRPWRVFRWRQGQVHYSGWYWSATTGGHVVYESRLELAGQAWRGHPCDAVRRRHSPGRSCPPPAGRRARIARRPDWPQLMTRPAARIR